MSAVELPLRRTPGSEATVVETVLETLELRVDFQRRRRRVRVLDGLSYQLAAGRTLGIVGESGAGKTVSSRALMGLLPPAAITSGSAKLGGFELLGAGEQALRRLRGSDIAMVFQDPARSLNPTMRIGAQITEAIRTHRQVTRAEARRRALELLVQMRLDHPEQRFLAYPHQLSGGMRQRVMIAIAIACDPRVLIADEPTKSLDVTTQLEIMQLLGDLQRRRGMAVILVSHDLKLAASFAHDVIVLKDGRVVESGTAEQVLERPQAAYTQALLDALPRTGTGRASGASRSSAGAPCAAHVSDHVSAEPLLEVRNLVQRFVAHGRAVHAVSGVSLKMWPRETVALVGESGSGKSTLALALLQMPAPVSGSVFFRGEDVTRLHGRALHAMRRRLQMVFQDPFGSVNPKWRIGSIIEEPLLGFGLGGRVERRRRVDELLERVNLPAAIYRERRPAELSGGQCQRVAIARALATRPDLIVCDEAVASLDPLIQAQILALFEDLRADLGLSYLFISHDLALVRRISHRTAVMHFGQLCEIGSTDALFRRPLHPYTLDLLASIPGTTERVFQPTLVRGDEASPVDPSRGCSFRARCPRAERLCALEAPPLAEAEDGHFVACHFPVTSERRQPAHVQSGATQLTCTGS